MKHPLHSFQIAFVLMSVFVVLEFVIAKLQKKTLFSFQEFFANITCGLLERISFLIFAIGYYYVLDSLYYYRIFTIPNGLITGIILFFLVDLLWYAYHRSGHRINILWAAHITHHQSKDYNLSLSFRVSIFQLIIRTFFWSILPILGFEPTLCYTMIGVNAAYQFFIHTHLINKLGILEKVLVTPSHHRVHHGSNDSYIDKNYGGIFIIWDKLFGTFAEEKEEVVYGITKDIKSYNPFTAWLHYFNDLRLAITSTPKTKDKLILLFSPPESMSSYYTLKEEKLIHSDTTKTDRYPKSIQIGIKSHLMIQLGWLMLGLWEWYGNYNPAFLWFYLLFCLPLYGFSIFVLHQFLQGIKPITVEIARILSTVAFLYYYQSMAYPNLLSGTLPLLFLFTQSSLYFIYTKQKNN